MVTEENESVTVRMCDRDDWHEQQFIEVGEYRCTYGSNCEYISTIWDVSVDRKMWLLAHLLLL